MIVADGNSYRTLEQDLFAGGKKVLEAYCNGNLVYPERENSQLLKVVGHINTIIEHNHTGENPSASDNAGRNYTYHDGDNYRAKGCFSLVLRSYNNSLSFQDGTTILPAAKWPLDGSFSESESRCDIYGPGNAWLVYLYQGSTAPMLPNGGGIHPLLGSDAIETHFIYGGRNRKLISAELLLHLDVSAPRICPFFADELNVGIGYPFLNAEATPLKPYLDEMPANVNGLYRMNLYKHDAYYGFEWIITGPTGKEFVVELAPGGYKMSQFCSHLKIKSSRWTVSGYSAPYLVRGTQHGVYRETQVTYTQGFKILNIPITDKLYLGPELTAPEEYLHPRLEDIEEFV